MYIMLLVAVVGMWLLFPQQAMKNPKVLLVTAVIGFMVIAGSCAGDK